MNSLAVLLLCAVVALSSAMSDTEKAYFAVSDSTWTEESTDLKPLLSVLDVAWDMKRVSTDFHVMCQNGIPDYSGVDARAETTWQNPHLIEEQNTETADKPDCLQVNPEKNSDGTTEITGGTIGYTINGVPLFTYTTSSGLDAVANEDFDSCGGHASPKKVYHYHGWLHDTADTDPCLPDYDLNACPAPLIGVSLDGFWIYGPQKCTCTTLDDATGECVSWPDTTAEFFTADDLDDCNGRDIDGTEAGDSDKLVAPADGEDEDLNNRSYEYRLSIDAPYLMSCYTGSKQAKCFDDNPCVDYLAQKKRELELEVKKEEKTLERLRALLKNFLKNY